MAARENYFVLLGLIPPVDDWPTIERAITEKKREWSRIQNTNPEPHAKRQAKRRLDDVKNMEATLRDPAARAKEAEGAQLEGQRLKDEAQAELRRHIEAIRATGTTYTTEQFQKLVAAFAGRLGAPDIQRDLAAAGLQAAQAEATRASRERLDASVAARIRGELRTVGATNLYELLGLSTRSSSRELVARAEDITREVLKSGATDAVSSARKQLAGECTSLFASDDLRRRYDNSLAFEVMEGFKSTLETMVVNSVLLPEQLRHIVEQAVAVGAQSDVAQEYILDYAAQRKWVVVAEACRPVNVRFCGQCSALAAPDAHACVNCGQLLELDCPRCKARVPTQFAACSSCGFHIANAHVVTAQLREAQRRSAAGEIDEALEAVRQGLLLWEGWEPLVEERRRIEARKKQHDATAAALDGLVQARKLYEARRLLERAARDFGPAAFESQQRQVAEGTRRADALVTRGETARRAGNTSEAVRFFEEALAACIDAEAAVNALNTCPPEAPRDARVRPLGKGFRLEWTMAGTSRYRIYRRAGGRPTGPSDAVRVGEVAGASYDDIEVESGVPWYYAVFAVRGEVLSASAALAGPCVATADVEHVQVTPGDGSLTLQWSVPPNAARVEVWRQVGREPSRRGDGQQVASTLTGVQDTGLQNGTTYGYLIHVVYADQARTGEAPASGGFRVRATPVAPPRMVSDLRAQDANGIVQLTWTPVPGALVELRWTDGPSGGVAGTVIARATTDRYGALIPPSSSGSASWTPGRQGVFRVTPITVSGDVATIGREALITTVVEVAQLRSQVVGRTIVLTWQWPAGVEDVMVRWSSDGFPGIVDAQGAKVSRRVYETKQSWDIQVAKPSRHYITVFTKAPGVEVYSAGRQLLEAMGDVAQVTYQVKIRKTLFGRLEGAAIELTSNRSAALRGVVVRAKAALPPVAPTDGYEVLSLDEVMLHQGSASIPLSPQHLDGRSYIKLFFRDARSSQDVKLLPGPPEKLRLG